ncbi:MAG: alpha/beta fold hydrolase [Candidatus Hermodarchaeota archaeon]
MTAQNQNPILFLHGWTKGAGDWKYFIRWFEADGWPKSFLYADWFDNPKAATCQDNIDNANKIKQWVDEILAETGAEKIDLVGHSMGGISSRYYIKFLDGIDKVDDYVSLGSPHHNFNMEDLNLNEGDETPGGILNDTIGERASLYSGYSYNGTHIPGNISYTSIYSPSDGVVSPLSSPLDGAKNITVEDLTHDQLYADMYVYTLVRSAVDDFNTTFFPTPPVLWALAGDGQVKLEWQAPVDDGGALITEYKIYRAASSGGPYSLIGSSITLSYVDLTVINGETYYYVVTAINSQGESEYSGEVGAIPQLSTSTTTASTPGWQVLFLLLSLLTLTQFRQLKKRQ